MRLVIVTSAHDFLAVGSQQDGLFEYVSDNQNYNYHVKKR